MKILIDMSNSPHVLFFVPIIKELEKRGHQVKILAREHAQTLDLLKLHNLEHVIIGKHAGKNIFKKILLAILRVIKIAKYISKEKPDICLSHQSPYIIYAGFLMNKKRIYIFDNECARLQNFLTFPLATKILCPESIKVHGKKFIKYSGIKETIYLMNFKINNKNIEKIKGIKKKKIFIRTEIDSAVYHHGNSLINLVKKLVLEGYKIIISPRTKKQEKDYKNINGVIVLNKSIHGPSLIKMVDLVMGGGGTMNREAAILGIPVISLYSGNLLAVDKYLIDRGLMIHNPNPKLKIIKKIMNKPKQKFDIKRTGSLAMKKIIQTVEGK